MKMLVDGNLLQKGKVCNKYNKNLKISNNSKKHRNKQENSRDNLSSK